MNFRGINTYKTQYVFIPTFGIAKGWDGWYIEFAFLCFVFAFRVRKTLFKWRRVAEKGVKTMSNVSMIDGHIDDSTSTDNEIIKALEKMLDIFRAYGVKTVPIRKDLIMNILSMYEHQKSEIEFLKATKDLNQAEFNETKSELELKNAEIERYKGVIKILENDVVTAKSEAIKEFAERLKSKFTHSGKSTKYGDFTWDDVTSYEIDNLVKEMAGETK